MKAKAWFEARGRSDKSRGFAIRHVTVLACKWPAWAKRAYLTGAMNQFSWGDFLDDTLMPKKQQRRS